MFGRGMLLCSTNTEPARPCSSLMISIPFASYSSAEKNLLMRVMSAEPEKKSSIAMEEEEEEGGCDSKGRENTEGRGYK